MLAGNHCLLDFLFAELFKKKIIFAKTPVDLNNQSFSFFYYLSNHNMTGRCIIAIVQALNIDEKRIELLPA